MAGAQSVQGLGRVHPHAGRRAPRSHGGGHRRADRHVRLHHPARHGAADVAGLHRSHPRGLRRDHEGPGAPGHRLRAQERRRHRDGPARQADPHPHEARRGRPAQGRRRRLRDLRQVRRARRDLVRPEHQPPARARRRVGPHHQGDRPRAGGARPPRPARAAAVLARQGRALRLDRAARARCAGGRPGARHPASGRFGRQWAEAPARLGRRRSRQPARRRRSRRRHRGRRHRPGAAGQFRAPHCAIRSRRSSPRSSGRAARACSFPPSSTSTASPRPSTNSTRRPGRALQPDARGILAAGVSKEGQVSVGNELPGGQQAAQGRRQVRKPRASQSKKSEEIVNYEISRTTKTEVTEGGRVKRISAAVLVDGSYAKNDKGESVYQPRSQGRARPHRRAGAHRHRLRPEARRPDRGREPALRRSARARRSRRRRPASCRSCSSPRTTSCAASSWS